MKKLRCVLTFFVLVLILVSFAACGGAAENYDYNLKGQLPSEIAALDTEALLSHVLNIPELEEKLLAEEIDLLNYNLANKLDFFVYSSYRSLLERLDLPETVELFAKKLKDNDYGTYKEFVFKHFLNQKEIRQALATLTAEEYPNTARIYKEISEESNDFGVYVGTIVKEIGKIDLTKPESYDYDLYATLPTEISTAPTIKLLEHFLKIGALKDELHAMPLITENNYDLIPRADYSAFASHKELVSRIDFKIAAELYVKAFFELSEKDEEDVIILKRFLNQDSVEALFAEKDSAERFPSLASIYSEIEFESNRLGSYIGAAAKEFEKSDLSVLGMYEYELRSELPAALKGASTQKLLKHFIRTPELLSGVLSSDFNVTKDNYNSITKPDYSVYASYRELVLREDLFDAIEAYLADYDESLRTYLTAMPLKCFLNQDSVEASFKSLSSEDYPLTALIYLEILEESNDFGVYVGASVKEWK